jgi:hypothetical protein
MRLHRIASLVFAAALMAPAAASAQQPPTCDRACLTGFMDQYLAALVAHDAHRLPLSSDIKYTENGQTLALTDGLWGSVAAPPSYRFDIVDPVSGEIAMMGIIKEGTNDNFISTRLLVENHKITEIENLVVRNLGGPQFARVPLTKPNPLFLETEPVNERLSRDKLEAIANSYFTGIDTETTAHDIPFDPNCQRMENGSWTANSPDPKAGAMQKLGCKAQFDTGFQTIVTNVRARRYPVIDPAHGLVYALAFFDHNGAPKTMGTADGKQVPVTGPFSQPVTFMLAEVFKVKDGKIRQIEAILTSVPYGMKSGW